MSLSLHQTKRVLILHRPTSPSTSPPARKRKREASTAPADDLRFLGDARKQFKAVKQPRRREVDEILGYLTGIEAPLGEGDASNLSAADARRLLSSNKAIDVPVFVANSLNVAGILDDNVEKRPVKQILDWLIDSTESTMTTRLVTSAKSPQSTLSNAFSTTTALSRTQ